MSNNKIIQSDNAVIDYTTISALINTVNAHESTIQQLVAANTHSSTIVDTTTGNTITTTGQQIVQANHVSKITPSQFKSVVVTFPQPFNNVTSVIGVVQSTKGNAYCYLSKTLAKDSAQFTIVAGTGVTTCNLYWIAVGN